MTKDFPIYFALCIKNSMFYVLNGFIIDIAEDFLGCDAVLCLRSMLFVPKDDLNC